jgi:hypothetical protein
MFLDLVHTSSSLTNTYLSIIITFYPLKINILKNIGADQLADLVKVLALEYLNEDVILMMWV